jgi:hypothetical protein
LRICNYGFLLGCFSLQEGSGLIFLLIRNESLEEGVELMHKSITLGCFDSFACFLAFFFDGIDGNCGRAIDLFADHSHRPFQEEIKTIILRFTLWPLNLLDIPNRMSTKRLLYLVAEFFLRL